MADLSVAVIGTGDPSDPGPEGYGMAYAHANAYATVADCELVACADIVEANAGAFAREFDIPEGGVFTDATEMLETVDPDVVSICTPVPTHEPLVVETAKTGQGLQAIHCEKPMADTWGGAQRMAAVAAEEDIQLTFNHQRRFGRPFRMAKELVDDGVIGDLQRIEFGSVNFFDYGTHSIDLANMINGEVDPEWVLANVDTREAKQLFDAYNENQSLAMWEYENGVFGMASTGDGAGAVPCHHRLIGSDGRIELGTRESELRVHGPDDTGWREIDTEGEGMHGPNYIDRAIAEIIDSLQNDTPSELGTENALRATAIIFGGYESARRNSRVTFPLDIADNPLQTLIEAQ